MRKKYKILYIIVINLIILFCIGFEHGVCAETPTLKNNGETFKIGVVLPQIVENPDFVFSFFRALKEAHWASNSVPEAYELISKNNLFIYKKITKSWISSYISLQSYLIGRGHNLSNLDIAVIFYVNIDDRKKLLEEIIKSQIKMFYIKIEPLNSDTSKYKIIKIVEEFIKKLLEGNDVIRKGVWDELVDKKRFKILISKEESVFPFAFRQKDELYGFDIKFSKKIADIMNVKADYILIHGTFEDIVNKLALGFGDAAFFISKSNERLNKVIMIPYFKVRRIVLAINVRGSRDSILSKLNSKTSYIYARQGSIYPMLATEIFPNANIITFQGFLKETIIKITKYKTSNKMAILTNKVRYDASGIEFEQDVLKLDYEYFCVAIRPNCPLLAQIIQENVDDRLKYDDIVEQYLHMYLSL